MIQPLAFEYINGGEFMKRFNAAIIAAAENCLDLRFPLKGKRTVAAKFVFVVGGNRSRPLMQPSLAVNLQTQACDQQFVAINLVSKTATLQNEEQPTLGEWEHHETVDCSETVPAIQDIRRGEFLNEINLGLMKIVENLCDLDTALNGRAVLEVKLHIQNADFATRRGKLEFFCQVIPKGQARDIAPVVIEAGTDDEDQSDNVPLYDQTKAKEASYA